MNPNFRLTALLFLSCLMVVWTACGSGNDDADDSSGNPTDNDPEDDTDDDAVDDDATTDDGADDSTDDDVVDDDATDDDSDDDSGDDSSDDSGDDSIDDDVSDDDSIDDDTTDDDTTAEAGICEVTETTPEGWQYCLVLAGDAADFELDSVVDASDVFHAAIAADRTELMYLTEDHGTWRREDVETDSLIRGPSIDFGPSGTVYIAYTDRAADVARLSTFEDGAWTTQDVMSCPRYAIVDAGDDGTIDVACDGHVATYEDGGWSEVDVMPVESYYEFGLHRDSDGDLHLCGSTGDWLRHGKRADGQWNVEVVDREAMQNCGLATDGNGDTFILSWEQNVGAAYWYENSSGVWTRMLLAAQPLSAASDLRVAPEGSIVFAAIKNGGYGGDLDGLLLYRYHNNFMDRAKLISSWEVPLTMDVGGDGILRTLVALDHEMGVYYFTGPMDLFNVKEAAAGKGGR